MKCYLIEEGSSLQHQRDTLTPGRKLCDPMKDMASLITDSWNQLVSWLKLVNTLGEISGQTAICAQKPRKQAAAELP